MSPVDTNALGDFLQASRSRITPEQAGLSRYGERRRVLGLRREEVAMLAGVSSSYYSRLEQGQSQHASPQVLDALASALQLDGTARAHLHRLGSPSGRSRPGPPEAVEPGLAQLLALLPHVPAVVLGRRNDVLAWNPLGHALLAGHLDREAPLDPDRRPNLSWLTFLDAETEALYADIDAKRRAVVGNLRLTAGRHPDDPRVAELVGSLAMASPEFATLWADHRVQACGATAYELDHPLVGRLTVTQQTLRGDDDGGQCLIVNLPAPGDSARACELLARLCGGAGVPAGGAEPGPGAR